MNDDDDYDVYYMFDWWDVLQIVVCAVMAVWSAWDAWHADTIGGSVFHSVLVLLFIAFILQIVRECRDEQ